MQNAFEKQLAQGWKIAAKLARFDKRRKTCELKRGSASALTPQRAKPLAPRKCERTTQRGNDTSGNEVSVW